MEEDEFFSRLRAGIDLMAQGRYQEALSLFDMIDKRVDIMSNVIKMCKEKIEESKESAGSLKAHSNKKTIIRRKKHEKPNIQETPAPNEDKIGDDIQAIVDSLDPYVILGVSQDATMEEINRAYKRLAILYHPDKNKKFGAEEAFKNINNAYNFLKEIEKAKDEYKERYSDAADHGHRSHPYEEHKRHDNESEEYKSGSGATSYNSWGNPFTRQDQHHNFSSNMNSQYFEEQPRFNFDQANSYSSFTHQHSHHSNNHSQQHSHFGFSEGQSHGHSSTNRVFIPKKKLQKAFDSPNFYSQPSFVPEPHNPYRDYRDDFMFKSDSKDNRRHYNEESATTKDDIYSSKVLKKPKTQKIFSESKFEFSSGVQRRKPNLHDNDDKMVVENEGIPYQNVERKFNRSSSPRRKIPIPRVEKNSGSYYWVLPVILLLIVAIYLFKSPTLTTEQQFKVYSYEYSNDFYIQRITKNIKIAYYVGDEFFRTFRYQADIENFEENIEREYLNNLMHSCSSFKSQGIQSIDCQKLIDFEDLFPKLFNKELLRFTQSLSV